MIQIISNTPIYVWPLLMYLVWGGWKSRKSYIISLKALLVMPTVMLIWSMYSTTSRFEISSLVVWALSLFIGVRLGVLTVHKSQLRFDKQQNLIEVGGSWTPMILSITIFSLRYFIGTMYGVYPNLVECREMLAVECTAALISSMFLGRLLGYYKRYKTAAHVDLKSFT